MNLDIKFSSKKCGEGIIAITAPLEEQIYLVMGDDSTLLIDTGMGIGSLKTFIEKFDLKNLIVVNTHGHPDHAGGNGEFSEVYLHPEDKDLYDNICSDKVRISDISNMLKKPGSEYENKIINYVDNVVSIEDSSSIDLGNRIIETMLIPGHTKGSICLFDKKTGTLFSGDMITATDTWLYLDCCYSLQTYVKTLKKLENTNWDIRQICPGHLPSPISPEMIRNKITCAEKILISGEKGEPFETFAGKGLRYTDAGTSIIYNQENIYD